MTYEKKENYESLNFGLSKSQIVQLPNFPPETLSPSSFLNLKVSQISEIVEIFKSKSANIS